ncbi:Multidrug resistance protein MdtN [Allorhodopirellula heiligendammensis]|uniref:Multidrug resistance protein MdtN n=2 Tax=Allorhodopirellula heiligendammensis TaxID=2714739 RepID=A0A5C6C769_9BACT|nr:Multidrug resistance protein MdtN [Allorhodopirellula heiligendammensis]
MIDESTSKATVVMSIESTQVKPSVKPVENPYSENTQTRSPAADRSGHAPGSEDATQVGNGSLSGTSAGDAHADAANELPVHPTRDLPNWLLLNIVVPLLLLAAAGGLVWFLGSVESAARPPIDDTPMGRLFALPAVDVVPVRSLASTGEKLHLSADGTVVPYREASLATEVAGRIVEKSPLCEAGKYVTKGHVLMKIDPTDYELEVKRLQRQQQQAYESLGEVDQEIINTNRSIELARAEIALQQREVKRREALPKQYASQGELDEARRAVLTAEQQLVLYQNQIDLAKKKRTRLESSERLAALQLDAATINLQRTEIIAPMDGVIVSEQAEINTFVSRGSPVVTMEDTSKVEVASKLRVDQLYWVLNQKSARRGSQSNAGEPAEQDRGYQLPPTSVIVRYIVSGREGLVYQWKGKLSGYDGIGLDEQTRTVPVRIVVDHPQAFQVIRDGKVLESSDGLGDVAGPTTLVRGMFVSLRLELDPAVELVVLPSEALKPGNRVWQFVADPRVLETSLLPANEPTDEAAAESPSPADVAADVTSETDGETGVVAEKTPALPDAMNPMAGFKPDLWVAGELRVLHGIRPVDQFIPTAKFTTGEDIAPTDEIDPDAGKAWICEIAGTALKDGAFVVVSPMGSIRTDAFPVRAPRAEVGGGQVDLAIASKRGVPEHDPSASFSAREANDR